MSPTPIDPLAAALAPRVVAALESERMAIEGDLGLIERTLFNRAWPLVLRIAPRVASHTVAAFRAEHGHRTVSELLDLLATKL